jgi:hypothetical protein
MKKAAAHPTQTTPPDPFTLGSLGLQFLDTTWRIAVPVVLFAVLGIVGDRHFGTKPWLTLAGMVFGFVIAGILLKNQIAAVNKKGTK